MKNGKKVKFEGIAQSTIGNFHFSSKFQFFLSKSSNMKSFTPLPNWIFTIATLYIQLESGYKVATLSSHLGQFD
jgi:hypothetical protein